MKDSKFNVFLKAVYLEFKCFSFRALYYRLKLAKCGYRLMIDSGGKIVNPRMVKIGNGVVLGHHTSIVINPLKDLAEVVLGDNVALGKYNSIGCSNKVIIEHDVITAPYVHITDRDHTYEDINIPIMHQLANSKGPVIIKAGCWLGYGVQVMAGVTIGKQSVIGAGSIVTKDVPDYSVVAGIPARLVRLYNDKTKKWDKV